MSASPDSSKTRELEEQVDDARVKSQLFLNRVASKLIEPRERRCHDYSPIGERLREPPGRKHPVRFMVKEAQLPH